MHHWKYSFILAQYSRMYSIVFHIAFPVSVANSAQCLLVFIGYNIPFRQSEAYELIGSFEIRLIKARIYFVRVERLKLCVEVIEYAGMLQAFTVCSIFILIDYIDLCLALLIHKLPD